MERVDEIIRRMNAQDKTLEQILWTLKGSDNLPIEGVLPHLKRLTADLRVLEKDVREMKEWREDVLLDKDKVEIKKIATWLGIGSTAVGVITAVYYLVRELMMSILK